MRYSKVLLLILLLQFFSCKPNYTAKEIVNKSIKTSRMHLLSNATTSFDFRGKKYTAKRADGNFEFTRNQIKDSISIQDILTNTGFKRLKNEQEVSLTEKEINSFKNSLNSVHYFSVLPFVLNDKAVFKKLLGTVFIKEVAYYKVEVTFSEKEGGEDFDDVFLYWFNTANFKMDYVAYKYQTNGGGVRFRDVKKEQVINGIRFLDYNNYKPLEKDLDFYKIDEANEKKQLKKLSEIVLENIGVTLP